MRYFSVLCLVLLVSCSSPVDPTTWTPPDAEPFGPPEVYETWWGETGACTAGHTDGPIDYDLINWFRVPGSSFPTPDHGMASGRWVAPYDVYIAEANLHTEIVVKHEMVHVRLQGGEADDPIFEECSGLAH